MESMAAVEIPAMVPAFDVSTSRRPVTAGLVLSSPSPPSLREELVGVVGKAFRPRQASGAGRPPWWAWALTALQAVFPVLQWGKTYTLKSFKSDVMAGLTLASLGIPQVRTQHRWTLAIRTLFRFYFHVHQLLLAVHH